MPSSPPAPALASAADRLATSAVRLTRWLRALDPAPQLTRAQASALAVIVFSGGVRPSELAELEGVERPTATRTITELVAGGLVVRRADPHDRRSVILQATPRGAQVFAAGHARRVAPLARALDQCSAEERARCVAAIDVLAAFIDRAVGAPRPANPERGLEIEPEDGDRG